MRHGWAVRGMLAALAGLVSALVLVGVASAAEPVAYAPLDRPGPPLTPSSADLASSLTCTDSLEDATKDPVLLSPGTATTGAESFAWNWEPALDQLGVPWCAIDLPQQALGPIDVAGEYLVHAIRYMHETSGRKVDILGWSQGGMSMRWSLRFWPDTRAMVDDVMGFAPSNHGTKLLSGATCASLGCRAAVIQQGYDSQFLKALNSGSETFAGISYTNVYSKFDEVVIPSSGPDNCSGCLNGPGDIANVQTQQLCPLDLSDHVLIGISPATYAIIVDAMAHEGPADIARIPKSACLKGIMPGVATPAAAAAAITLIRPAIGTLAILPGPLPNPVVSEPVQYTEPPVPCYAFATCDADAPEPAPAPAKPGLPLPVVAGGDDSANVPAPGATQAPAKRSLLAGVGTAVGGLLGSRH